MGGVEELGRLIEEAVLPLVKGKDRICLIDPPGHPNVGDHAIFLGELQFLSRNIPNSKLSFYDIDNYSPDADEFIENSSAILIHGGGNFGDIWPHHHRIRKQILTRFRSKPVIQMPQSISFSDEGERLETQRLIAAHPNFTMLVRDVRSLEYARANFDCETLLCPDMAFSMGAIRRKPARVEVSCLLRTDKERAADHEALRRQLADLELNFVEDDWLDAPRSFVERADRHMIKVTRKRPRLTAPFQSLLVGIRKRYSEERLARGVALLSAGRVVVTDRLHAHIMSCLLGIPNVVFDSWDGKISALHQTWTKGRFPCRMAQSPAEIGKDIRGLAQEHSLG